MDTGSGSQTTTTPIDSAQGTQQFDRPQQMHANPPTQERVFQATHERHKPAELYPCTHDGCVQRFEDHLEVQNHIRAHHQSQPIEDDRNDRHTDLSDVDVTPARAQSFPCELCPKRFTRAYTLR